MTMANDLALLEAAGVKFIDGNGVSPCVRLRKTHEPASANQKRTIEILGRGRLQHQDGAQNAVRARPEGSDDLPHSGVAPPFRKQRLEPYVGQRRTRFEVVHRSSSALQLVGREESFAAPG